MNQFQNVQHKVLDMLIVLRDVDMAALHGMFDPYNRTRYKD